MLPSGHMERRAGLESTLPSWGWCLASPDLPSPAFPTSPSQRASGATQTPPEHLCTPWNSVSDFAGIHRSAPRVRRLCEQTPPAAAESGQTMIRLPSPWPAARHQRSYCHEGEYLRSRAPSSRVGWPSPLQVRRNNTRDVRQDGQQLHEPTHTPSHPQDPG